MKVLVVASHPDLKNSTANKTILDYLAKNATNLTIRHLDTLYPNFKIDIDAEQEALKAADIIVLQFPFYWYSTPALMKLWIDQVWNWGFAYGHAGDKLKGKFLIPSITVGGPQESYSPNGYNHFSVEQFLRPLEQTAYLAKMYYEAPIYTHRNFYIKGVWNSKKAVSIQATEQAQQVIDRILSIANGPKERIHQFVYQWFKHFDVLDENGYFVQYLDKEVKMKFPDSELLTGHEGFHTWYNQTKSNLKGTTIHNVKKVSIDATDNHQFKVALTVELLATTVQDEKLHITVDEFWLVQWNYNSQHPSILEYWVTLND